MRLIRIT